MVGLASWMVVEGWRIAISDMFGWVLFRVMEVVVWRWGLAGDIPDFIYFSLAGGKAVIALHCQQTRQWRAQLVSFAFPVVCCSILRQPVKGRRPTW